MIRSEWLAKLLRCYKGTIDLLEVIRSDTPYKYKELIALDLMDFKACPTWLAGTIVNGAVKM